MNYDKEFELKADSSHLNTGNVANRPHTLVLAPAPPVTDNSQTKPTKDITTGQGSEESLSRLSDDKRMPWSSLADLQLLMEDFAWYGLLNFWDWFKLHNHTPANVNGNGDQPWTGLVSPRLTEEELSWAGLADTLPGPYDLLTA